MSTVDMIACVHGEQVSAKYVLGGQCLEARAPALLLLYLLTALMLRVATGLRRKEDRTTLAASGRGGLGEAGEE